MKCYVFLSLFGCIAQTSENYKDDLDLCTVLMKTIGDHCVWLMLQDEYWFLWIVNWQTDNECLGIIWAHLSLGNICFKKQTNNKLQHQRSKNYNWLFSSCFTSFTRSAAHFYCAEDIYVCVSKDKAEKNLHMHYMDNLDHENPCNEALGALFVLTLMTEEVWNSAYNWLLHTLLLSPQWSRLIALLVLPLWGCS